MHGAVSLVLLSLVLIQGAAATASQKQPQRIRFERGKSSATIHGHLAGFDTSDYVVGATSGQQMDISLKASNQETYFVLYSINILD
jgi:hypothetical protein